MTTNFSAGAEITNDDLAANHQFVAFDKQRYRKN